jgi:hypothetical protein
VLAQPKPNPARLLSKAGGVLLFIWALALGAQQLFVPVSVAELCGMSAVIVDGTVARVDPARANADGKLETAVQITVSQGIKGAETIKSLTLIEPGGKLGAREEVYFGQIIPNVGERYILFLKRDLTLERDPAAFRALGGLHGHYRIINGRIVVHPAMPRILRTGFHNAPVEKLLREVRAELANQ